MRLDEVIVGDVVIRLLGGAVRMRLTVTDVDERLIHCGLWTFDRATGAEVDDDLGWGPAHGRSGSFLVEVERRGGGRAA